MPKEAVQLAPLLCEDGDFLGTVCFEEWMAAVS